MLKDLQFTIGADPELFIKRKDTKKEFYVTAKGMVPGTKEHPFKVPKGAIQKDGTAAEININPVTTEEQFVDNIRSVIRALKDSLPDGHVLCASPVVEFTEEEWQDTPQEDRILGCNPDYSAYTGEANPTPNGDVSFRTGAGHIHIGWGSGFDKNNKDLHMAARYLSIILDYYLGMPLSYVAQDSKRRELYGNFGCYRTTSFGMEYRTPSNFWLSTEENVRNVFISVQEALKAAKRGVDPSKTYGKYWINSPFLN